MVNIEHKHDEIAPHANEGDWYASLLQPLLASLPPHTEMAVHGRAPNWVYGALAMHAYPQPFHQFDGCIGWVQPRELKVGNPKQQCAEIMTLDDQELRDDVTIVHVHLTYYYVDYDTEADQLVFPEPPADKGVIISGKLPLWLFTSLTRFYAQKHVPWIALNDASDNRPIVVYSRVASHSIGQALPKLNVS
ncbi:MAG TPA: CRISPR-associated protein Csx3 [Ktedonobacteraceae bacterium]|nr:CRISPR-associated protein Csx3 [Ktedonobacteraceae bacterium]